MDSILFYILATVAVVAAGAVVLHRNPVKSAFALIVVMLALGIIYLQLSAGFLAIIQIMVYAGAVMVLFLFVLFLLNVGVESPFSQRWYRRAVAGVSGLLMGVILAGIFFSRGLSAAHESAPALASDFGNIEPVGELLFTRYLLPFELLSVLLLAAIIGAVLVTRPIWPASKFPKELWPAAEGAAAILSDGDDSGTAPDNTGEAAS